MAQSAASHRARARFRMATLARVERRRAALHREYHFAHAPRISAAARRATTTRDAIRDGDVLARIISHEHPRSPRLPHARGMGTARRYLAFVAAARRHQLPRFV